MKDFHSFISKLLLVWMGVYLLLLAPGLVKGLLVYLLFDFDMPEKHYLDIISTVYQGALWLVPTAFLWVAYFLSRPNRRFLQG